MNLELSDVDYLSFAGFGVATIYESYERRGLINLDLIQIIPGTHVAGPARTVLLGKGGNRAVHKVMKELEPKEILVIASEEPQPVALIGELLAVQARNAGAGGILVDGAVRDVDSLRRLGLPIWARWIRANGPGKSDESLIEVEVSIGGTIVRPGDVIVLDGDGAVAIKKEDAAMVLGEAQRRVDREKEIQGRLSMGEHTFDIYALESGTE